MSLTDQDEALISAALEGSARAWERLVRRYEGRVYNFALRMTGNETEALDLMQEVFLGVYRNLQRFRGDSQFTTWLFRIAHNEAISMHRKNRLPVAEGEDLEAADAEASGPARSLGNRVETTLMVEQALASLPLEQREAVTLKVYQGFKFDEIAAIVDCPVSTAKSRVYAGLEALKQKLAPARDEGREAHAQRSS